MRLTTHIYKYEETCEMVNEERVVEFLSGNEVEEGQNKASCRR